MTGERVTLPPDLEACPLLGLPDDPSTHFAFAHRAHLCHATPRPASVDVTYQARLCLTPGFPACERYRAWAATVAATVGPPPEPELVGVMESIAERAAAVEAAAAAAAAESQAMADAAASQAMADAAESQAMADAAEARAMADAAESQAMADAAQARAVAETAEAPAIADPPESTAVRLPEPPLPAEPEVVAPIESMAPSVATPPAVPDMQKPLEQAPSPPLPFEPASPPMPEEAPAIAPISPIPPIPPIVTIPPSPPEWELPTAGAPLEAMSDVSPEAAPDHPTEAQPLEPPPDFDVWSAADDDTSAADDDAAETWSPGSPDPADGNGAADLLAALNEWPAIQPLAPREQRTTVAAPLPPVVESDAWPPAPSLTGRSAGATIAVPMTTPAVVRTAAGAPSPPAVELPVEPVRATLDAAALRRTRLPLLVVLLAIALLAGFAAGPWLLSQFTGAAPGPSDPGGALASLQPPGAPSPAPPSTSPSAAAPSASATAASSPAGSGRPTTYTVKRNDTLNSIAKAFGTTVARLMALNHITDPNRIVVGQKLILPTN